MTDKEIIKALDEWRKAIKDDYKRLQLLDAPMDCFEESHTVNFHLLSNAIDFINRQQAEIERLNGLVTDGDKAFNKMTELYNRAFNRCRKAKTEAIKEFAERLKEKAVDVGICDAQGNGYGGATVILIGDIDNLVKEMVGEKK